MGGHLPLSYGSQYLFDASAMSNRICMAQNGLTVTDGPAFSCVPNTDNDENEDDISTPHGGAIGNRAVSGLAFLFLRATRRPY